MENWRSRYEKSINFSQDISECGRAINIPENCTYTIEGSRYFFKEYWNFNPSDQLEKETLKWQLKKA